MTEPPADLTASGRSRNNRLACDNCSSRKRKCIIENDSEAAKAGQPGSQICDYCKSNGVECTYIRERKKRGPQAQSDLPNKRARSRSYGLQPSGSGSDSTASPAAKQNSVIPEYLLPYTYDPGQLKVPLVPSAATSFQASHANVTAHVPISYEPSHQSAPINWDLPWMDDHSLIGNLGDLLDLPQYDWQALAQDLTLEWPQSTWKASLDSDQINGASLEQTAATHQTSQMLAGTLLLHQPPQLFDEALPPDAVLQTSLDAFLSTFYKLCPIFKTSSVTQAMARGEHKIDGPLQMLLLAIVGLVEVATRLQNGTAVGSEGQKMGTPGPCLLKAVQLISLSNAFPPHSPYSAAACMLLSIAYHSLGDMPNSLYWMQESITISQVRLELHMIGILENAQQLEDCLRLGWMTFIMERAFATLLPDPTALNFPLRFPDDFADATYSLAFRLENGALDDFPYAHLRLFSIIDRDLLECWRGTCMRSARCRTLTPANASRVQHRLKAEVAEAADDFERIFATLNRSDNMIRATNMLLTVRWLQARFWMLSKQHGLIHPQAAQELQIGFVEEILSAKLQMLQRLRAHELDNGLDWALKLFDLVMICVTVIREEAFLLAQGTTAEDIKQKLMPFIYCALGLLANHAGAQKRFMPQVVTAISTIT